jgi:hypothetical protein
MKMQAEGQVTLSLESGDSIQLEVKSGQIYAGKFVSHGGNGTLVAIDSGAGSNEVRLCDVANLFVKTSSESGMLMPTPRFFVNGLILAVAGTVSGALPNPSVRPVEPVKPPFTFATFGVSPY